MTVDNGKNAKMWVKMNLPPMGFEPMLPARVSRS